MEIDLLYESDIPAAVALSTQAGWNQFEQDWRRMLALWSQGCFAGRFNGRLVATTTLATYGTPVGWVGLVLVDEAHRGQGFGGLMLDAMLQAAQDRGIKTLGLDATELGRPLYLARGFADVATLGRWIWKPKTHSLKSNVSEQKNDHSWDSILALDRRSTRIDRSLMLRHLRDEPNVRWRAIGPTAAPIAYSIARPGRTALHIGPVVAESESAATDLLDVMMDQSAQMDPQPVIMDIPTGRLESWLQNRGFNLLRSVVRMQAGIRGPDLLGKGVFAASGFDLG